MLLFVALDLLWLVCLVGFVVFNDLLLLCIVLLILLAVVCLCCMFVFYRDRFGGLNLWLVVW